MKTVAYYTFGDMLPTDVGNKKAMFEYFRYLVSRKEIRLILVIIGTVSDVHMKIYEEMGAEVRIIIPHSRWNICEILNKVGSRLGIDMWRSYFSSLGYRSEFQEACSDADVILMTYAFWNKLLPLRTLKERTIVLTHDLFFYARASLNGTNTWWKRLSVKINKIIEISVLKRFRKIAVLADYEQELLMKSNIPSADIIQIGMPITIPYQSTVPIPFSDRKFDFLLVARGGYANRQTVRCFIERVAPLLPNRHLTFALVGKVSQTADTSGAPENLEFIRLGCVSDLEPFFMQSRIGVGVVPYGSGIKVKVVEMAMHNLPLVVTSKGEEGIPLSGDGFINIDLASQEEVKTKLQCWLDHPEIAQQDGMETGRYVAEAFSPDNILKNLVKEILK